MANLSFAEVSAASRSAMLAAKVCKAVRRARRASPLDVRERGILGRGANLLSEIVQGSLLIERRPLEQGSRADLNAYEHALSVLAILNHAEKETDVTDLFKAYREDLLTLSNGEIVPEDRLDRLSKFFSVLGDFFFRDVQKASPPVHLEPMQAMA